MIYKWNFECSLVFLKKNKKLNPIGLPDIMLNLSNATKTFLIRFGLSDQNVHKKRA